MTLSEILTLAKAGYKAKEINELIDKEKKEAEQATLEEKEPENAVEEPEVKEPENAVEEPEKEPEPDYKAMYEESQKALKAAQAVNVNTNVQPELKKDEEVVADLLSHII